VPLRPTAPDERVAELTPDLLNAGSRNRSMGRITHVIAPPRVSLTLALVAVAMVCAACGEAAHTAPHSAAATAPHCLQPVISGGLPATYLRESTVIGPLAIYPAKAEYPNFRPGDFAPVSGHSVSARFSSLDAAVTVSAIGRVTVSIPANQQDHARLLFDRSRFGNAGYRLSDGSGSYTFIGCKNPYTQYQRLPRSPWNFGDGDPGVIVTQ
jgi:hypothetical protein